MSIFRRLMPSSLQLLAIVFFCTVTAFLPSESTALEWNALGPAGAFISRVVPDPTNPGVLYIATTEGLLKSADGGNSWLSINTGLPGGGFQGLAIDPENHLRLYAGSSEAFNGMFRTSDGGATWEPINGGLPGGQARIINVVTVDPNSPCTVFIGTNDAGVFRSTDCGDTWNSPALGPTGDQRVLAVAVDPNNSSRVYLGTQGGGVFRSIDGGITWLEANIGIPTFADPDGRVVNAIAVNPENSQVLYVGFRTGGVFRSTNGGISWSALNAGIPQTTIDGAQNGRAVTSLVFDPSESPSLYFSSEGDGVFRLGPGQDTWSSHNFNLGNLRIRSLATHFADSEEEGVLYAGSRGDGVFVLRIEEDDEGEEEDNEDDEDGEDDEEDDADDEGDELDDRLS